MKNESDQGINDFVKAVRKATPLDTIAALHGLERKPRETDQELAVRIEMVAPTKGPVQ